MKISDIIDISINRHLWEGDNECWGPGEGKYEYSCAALGRACKYDACDRTKLEAFLVPMGVECRGIAEQLKGIPAGRKRQYARALWLTWAAMIAREEEI